MRWQTGSGVIVSLGCIWHLQDITEYSGKTSFVRENQRVPTLPKDYAHPELKVAHWGLFPSVSTQSPVPANATGGIRSQQQVFFCEDSKIPLIAAPGILHTKTKTNPLPDPRRSRVARLPGFTGYRTGGKQTENCSFYCQMLSNGQSQKWTSLITASQKLAEK